MLYLVGEGNGGLRWYVPRLGIGADEIEWLIDWDPASNVCSSFPIGDGKADNPARKLDVAFVLCLLLAVLCVIAAYAKIQELTSRPSLRLGIMATEDRQVGRASSKILSVTHSSFLHAHD